MRVVVRVRPANDRETDQRSIVNVLNDLALMFDPKEEVDHFYFHGARQIGRDLLRKANKELRFNFDTVFSDGATNEEVHVATTRPIMEGLLNGYNCSVFAYGATGAGKTFTMLGDSENPGITFLTVKELFERLEALRSDMIIDLAVSYLEVYNENVKDLLTPSGILQVREDQHRGVIVPGLTLHKPKGAEELLEMLRLGNHRRTQHPTDANAESSRSHAVFTVYVKQQDRPNGSTSGLSATRVAKMALIDLAGSERASMVSRGNGSRLREGANINKSLLALGNCINALADKKGHVPFRNSKLTRILKDSLDGNCRTVMIAAISPAASNYEDTYNTLRYATRAKNIKTNSRQNVVDILVPAGQHMKIIEELRNEVANLKERLQEKPSPSTVTVVATPLSINCDEVEAIRGVMKDIFGKRETLTRQFLEMSCRVREMELRVQRRQRCMERLAIISVNSNRMDQSASKMDNAVARMVDRRERQLTQRKVLGQCLTENSAALAKAEEKAAATNSEVLCEWLKSQHSKLDSKVAQFRERHACRAAVIQEQETSRCDRLLSEILRVVQRQYLILIANGLATSDIVEDFESVLKQVEGVKEVAWADQLNEEQCADTQLNIDSILNLSIAPLTILAEANSKELVSVKETTIANITKTKPGRLHSPTCGKLLTKPILVASGQLVDAITHASSCSSPTVHVVTQQAAVDTSAAGLNSTFSKEESFVAADVARLGQNGVDKGAAVGVDVTIPPRSNRRLTFDALEPLVLPESAGSPASELEKENTGISSKATPQHLALTSSDNCLASNSKRHWGDIQRNEAAKKMKPSASLSNLSTAKSLRKLGFQSMFDKPNAFGEASSKIKLPTFSKFGKSTPIKRNVLEPINTNGHGMTAINPLQLVSCKRPSKPGWKPTIKPKTNALSRQRSKSVTSLKTSQ